MRMNFYKNIMSSIIVFFVALPLNIGIALASQVPVSSAIVTGVIGGILVGLISGAPLLVSGPAAGLTVVVYQMVSQWGLQGMWLATAIAGILQIVMGFLRTARWALLIAPSVIHGMLAGIGVLIILGQVHVILGHQPYGSAIDNLKQLPSSLTTLHGTAVVMGVTTFVFVEFWKRKLPRWNLKIPGSLISVVLLTLISVIFELDLPRVRLEEHLQIFHLSLQWPSWQLVHDIFIPAFTLAIIASAESILSALAVDKMHNGERAQLDKELIAQGMGNLLAGLFGGIPMTGVIVRSAANVSAGATNRLSTIFHGLWLLLFITYGSQLIMKIPLSVLAGLLISVGLGLINFKHFQHFKRYKEDKIYVVTLLGVIFLGLLNGIVIGLAMTLYQFLSKAGSCRISVDPAENDKKVKIKVSGGLTFLSVPKLSQELDRLPKGQQVELSFEITHADLTAVDFIREWKERYEKQGGSVKKTNLEPWLSGGLKS